MPFSVFTVEKVLNWFCLGKAMKHYVPFIVLHCDLWASALLKDNDWTKGSHSLIIDLKQPLSASQHDKFVKVNKNKIIQSNYCLRFN